MLTLLWLGNSQFTHGNLLIAEPASVFTPQGKTSIALNPFVECPLYEEECRIFYLSDTLRHFIGGYLLSASNAVAFLTILSSAR
jgi:hypothetical protein